MQALHKVFVYGTLKRGYYNYRLLIDKANGVSVFIGEARLEVSQPLVVTENYGIPALLPNVPPEKGYCQPKEIYGELFEVDDSMLKVLDQLEKHPTWYIRTDTTCVLSSSESDKYKKGSSVPCQVYVLNDPGPEYYSLPYISNYKHSYYVPPEERNTSNV